MKYLCSFLLCCIATLSFSQQITTIFNEGSNSKGLAIDGSNLYIANPSTNNSKIYTLDYTTTNPVASVFLDNIEEPTGMAVHEGFLYVCFNSNNPSLDKVGRIDLSQSNPVIEDVVVISNPEGVAFRDNEMYISGGSKIFRVDISSSNPTPVEIISGNTAGGTIGLCVADHFLYVTNNDEIKKYDIELANPPAEVVVTGLNSLTGITRLTDDRLFFSSYGPDSIYEFDTMTNTFTELFTNGVITAWDLLYNGEFLYVSNLEGGEVNQIDISALSVEDFNFQPVVVYPNPTSGFIQVNIAEGASKVTIINSLGQQVKELSITSEVKIDVSELPQGVYYLQLDNRKIAKFIKE